MSIIGIDPGSTGGIAVVYPDRSGKLYKSSTTDADVVDILKTIKAVENPSMAVVERVASFPGQGAVSTFTFGKRFGVIRGALLALGIPMVDVPAQTWQKVLGLSQPKSTSKGEDPKEKKKRLADRRKQQKRLAYDLARQLYPGFDITVETADGLLLAEYGLRTLSVR
ncbi:MAG: hypothetical protein E6R03_08960 [Hyphomicrobiaceae bacterium]|nr:MAG: hypothetical protein E6R03_08960 [Hyphomicrobiaceae bacterium]